MAFIRKITGNVHYKSLSGLFIILIISCISSCDNNRPQHRGSVGPVMSDTKKGGDASDDYHPVYGILVVPRNPEPGKNFRIVFTGAKNIRKDELEVSGPAGNLKSVRSKTANYSPYWRIDDFGGSPAGRYKVTLAENKKVVCTMEFTISDIDQLPASDVIWKTTIGWNPAMETLYAAWINVLFSDSDENSSWSSLSQAIQNKNQNFLYDYLSRDEDNPDGKNRLAMQPDCADNPFFLRAYFAWKLGLPFGYHLCDRGSLVHSPKTGEWITNQIPTRNKEPLLSFNAFLRRVMDGVHSGTARTALDDESSDYYPVSLDRISLHPGIVYADPYGHTLTLIGWIPQTPGHPGLLLSVDAQPDGTVGIKRFWKGNFLFNTSDVVGEPGFKAFRPISLVNGVPHPLKNKELTASSGFDPFSLQQRKMKSDVFYHSMERLINPEPLDPEVALLDLIDALHEQLLVRVTSVANGEAYFKSHPGVVIPMPSSAAGIFQAGGQWENFSTPNRDLRLLIAIDALLDFPEKVGQMPEDYNISKLSSPEQVSRKLQSMLDRKAGDLSISYTRSDGSSQKLTLAEILKRRDAFEMAYNPNDGIELRWGAPENSEERATCHRQAPASQLATMLSVRTWFHKRLHPPT